MGATWINLMSDGGISFFYDPTNLRRCSLDQLAAHRAGMALPRLPVFWTSWLAIPKRVDRRLPG